MNALTNEEMEQIEGGVGPIALLVIGAIIGAVVSNVLDNWPDFKKGVIEGYSSVASN